jgi:hypothetical protein
MYVEEYKKLTAELSSWERTNRELAEAVYAEHGAIECHTEQGGGHQYYAVSPDGQRYWLCTDQQYHAGYKDRLNELLSKLKRLSDAPPEEPLKKPEPIATLTVKDLIQRLMLLPMDSEVEMVTVGPDPIFSDGRELYQHLTLDGHLVEHSTSVNRTACLVFRAAGKPYPTNSLNHRYSNGTVILTDLKRPEGEVDGKGEAIFKESAPVAPKPDPFKLALEHEMNQIGGGQIKEIQQYLDLFNMQNQEQQRQKCLLQEQQQLQDMYKYGQLKNQQGMQGQDGHVYYTGNMIKFDPITPPSEEPPSEVKTQFESLLDSLGLRKKGR